MGPYLIANTNMSLIFIKIHGIMSNGKLCHFKDDLERLSDKEAIVPLHGTHEWRLSSKSSDIHEVKLGCFILLSL